MDSSGMLRALLLAALLCVACRGLTSQEVSEEDSGPDRAEPDRDLVSALEVLLREHSRVRPAEKRGSIAMCGTGDRCAVKFGPRIRKLCDCGRAANCNSYLLKCI
ncbi:cocaine- and amphetamine-regulated transcript-like [Pseudoliparis swirei]|uniref:cocaine- and amphetamine-regulated transcript-like n=1 Tax=Pseudoliparis swirei TaxID=2059687 RepID=UPI0024BE1F00|nr:cocaine- and amphetamine-regulated transcript-like [Pseudoliparis swirei]